MKKATDFLKEGAEVLGERGKQYDQPDGERSMGKAVKAFEVITGKTLTEAEGWLFMQVLKDVRQWSRSEYHEDSAVDSVNYAALKSEALSRDVCQQHDSWIEWHGGECPVNNDVDIVVLLRNGALCDVLSPSGYDWDHAGDASTPYDIVKYKIITKE